MESCSLFAFFVDSLFTAVQNPHQIRFRALSSYTAEASPDLNAMRVGTTSIHRPYAPAVLEHSSIQGCVPSQNQPQLTKSLRLRSSTSTRYQVCARLGYKKDRRKSVFTFSLYRSTLSPSKILLSTGRCARDRASGQPGYYSRSRFTNPESTCCEWARISKAVTATLPTPVF